MKTLRGHLKSWAVGLVAVMLTSLYPCIFIFAQNAGEAKLGDTRLFACIFLLTALAMLLVTGMIFRNMSRAAFMTCLGMLVVINFTMVSQAIKGKLPWLRDRYQLLLIGLLFLLILILMLKKKPNMTAGCGIIALTFGALCFISGIIAAPKLISGATQAPPPDAPEEIRSAHFSGEKRDVYYLLFDEYGGTENLETYFGFDNSAFYDALKERGFSVSETSRNTESCWTEDIVPNLMNLDYVVNDDMTARARRTYLENPVLVQLFWQNGYQVNLINHWRYLRFPAKELTRGQHEDTVSSYLLEHSLFQQIPPLRDRINLKIFMNYRDNYVGPVENAVEALEGCADQVDGPTLTVSYIQSPHAPFVFHKDGSIQSDKSKYWYWKEPQLYTDQLQYINSVILKTIDSIQSKDPDAVILLLSDHGARVPLHMVEQFGGPWFDAKKETPVMQNALVSAYIPGQQLNLEGQTGINATRMVLNGAFGLNLSMVPPAEGYVLPDYFNSKDRPEPKESEEEPEESTIEDSAEKWDKPDKHHEKGPGKPDHKPRKDASGPKPPKR